MLSGSNKHKLIVTAVLTFIVGLFIALYPLSRGQGIALGTSNEPGLLAQAEVLRARAEVYQNFGQMVASSGPAAIQIGAAAFAVFGGIGIAYILLSIGYNIQTHGKIRLIQADREATHAQRRNLLAAPPRSTPPAITRRANNDSSVPTNTGSRNLGKGRKRRSSRNTSKRRGASANSTK